MKRHYVGYVTTGREHAVAEALTWEDYECWSGRVRVRDVTKKMGRGTGARVDYTYEPALPNYLWLQLDDAEFYSIHKEGGVIGKHLHRTLMPLTDLGVREFEKFRDRIDRMGILERLTPGDMVRVIDGPLDGALGRFSAFVEATNSVVVQMDVLGKETRVTIPAGTIKAAE